MMKLIALSLIIGHGFCFYLPGLAPVNFCEKDKETSHCKSQVKLMVNRLDSKLNTIPYEYHHFDFCLGPEDESPVENLGQVLTGERIRPSQYEVGTETFYFSDLCSSEKAYFGLVFS
ncbi:unnamed protein product [Soboliphyme baturini]|uniref:Transmembrane 9 superfamily member n=1 Tax=Soboliphyme baturini TaxID=241478 RepID=A0A183IDU8_9BILA|nr:unnamed protein product [Soboliphyme baturini]